MLLAWHKYGGGKELLDKLYASIGANVVSFPYGPMPTQPLGWFKKPITKADDFKGLKYRTVGISIDVFTGMGAAVNALPGGEIVPAMDRGLLDAAEFNNAIVRPRCSASRTSPRSACCRASTRTPSSSRSCSTRPSTTRCRTKLKAIIANAVEAASADMSWKAIDRYSKDYVELQTKDKVKFYKTPDAILQEQLERLRPGRGEEGGGQSAVQGDHRVAEGVRRARGASGTWTTTSAGAWRTTITSAEAAAGEEGLSVSRCRARHHPARRRMVFFCAAEPAWPDSVGAHARPPCRNCCCSSTRSAPGSARRSPG